MEKYKGLVIGGITVIIFIVMGLNVMSLFNQETELRTEFEEKANERKAFYDNMYKSISQVSQVAVKNDSSFRKNVQVIMEGRKDSEGIVMKWVTETNPNANYSEVSKLYQNLTRLIEAKRDSFFDQEKQMSSIVAVHTKLLRRFPAGWILRTFFDVEFLVYNPISSSQTEEVFKTGKDDNVNLGL